jgi:hypothetical protein
VNLFSFSFSKKWRNKMSSTIAKGEDRKKYKLVNNTDGNIEIELESDTEEESIAEALEILGWSLVAYKNE